jgi:DNA repair photolyase
MWGTFVDVKINAPTVLERELRRGRKGRVFISSVCDGWQPAEAQYGLTRQCLEMLLKHGYPVSILTKSALVRRDFDLLAGRKGVSFGMTITTVNESLYRFIEPRASLPPARLAVLEEAKSQGLRTHAFLGPLMPYLSDNEENLLPLLRAVEEVGVDYFYVDQLNRRFGLWPALKRLLGDHFPELIPAYQRLFFDEPVRENYTKRLALTVRGAVRKLGLEDKLTLCF